MLRVLWYCVRLEYAPEIIWTQRMSVSPYHVLSHWYTTATTEPVECWLLVGALPHVHPIMGMASKNAWPLKTLGLLYLNDSHQIRQLGPQCSSNLSNAQAAKQCYGILQVEVLVILVLFTVSVGSCCLALPLPCNVNESSTMCNPACPIAQPTHNWLSGPVLCMLWYLMTSSSS